MLPSDNEVATNFLAGGLMAVLFIFLVNRFKDDHAAEITQTAVTILNKLDFIL